jgi:hypothetical protein
MQNATAGMANKITQKTLNARKLATERAALDNRYGQIGISAVAAAVRYQGAAKNPAYAPSPLHSQERAEDTAA